MCVSVCACVCVCVCVRVCVFVRVVCRYADLRTNAKFGVAELKSIALNMRDEVKVQSAMVDEITNKVDAASTHLNTLNKRMKQTLAQTRSADRFILDFILLIILLAIIGYIVSLATGTR